MDEFSDKEVKMTQRELTHIKSECYDRGWRYGMMVGGIIAAVCFIVLFAVTNVEI